MMQKELEIICGRCGYRYTFSGETRCPRCFEPSLKMGSCSGRCKECREDCKETGKRER